MTHFEYGALDKDTKKFVEPKYAKRRTKYSCPDCERDVHVCKGEIRIPYFAHDPDPENRCTYFNPNPSSIQQHKNAQFKLREFLNNGTKIDILRPCLCGRREHTTGRNFHSYFGKGKVEYKFTYNNSNRFADVALVDGDKIIVIFEIVHTHYTLEKDRPDPWFEIAAKEINNIPIDSKEIVLTCLRQLRSPECIKEEEELKRKKQEEIERQNKECKERMERSIKEQEERMKIWHKEQQERYEKSLKEQEEHESWRKEQQEYHVESELLRKEQYEERERWRKEFNENHDLWDKEHKQQRERERSEAIRRAIQIENELKENREARRKFEEEKKKSEEDKKKTEERNKQLQFELLQLSRQVPKCNKCSPFITLDYKDWNWRCNACKVLIKDLHLKHHQN